MRFVIILTALLLAFVPVSAQKPKQPATAANPQDVLRARVQGFMTARQTLNGPAARRYCNPDDVKKIHQEMKLLFARTKDGLKDGDIKPDYVKQSVTDGSLAEPYKKAILKYLLDNADFDRELDTAFTRYMVTLPYKITKFEIGKIALLQNSTAEAHVVEFRQGPGQKQPESVPVVYKWKLVNNEWYLSIDRSLEF